MISKKIKGRKCYDHLGGSLGAELLNFFLAQQWIELDEGKTTVYVITEKGYREFEKMGLFTETGTEGEAMIPSTAINAG